jgi:hypothetical protein
MDQYLKKEKEILEITNSDFFDLQKVKTNWYSVKGGVINKHNKLVHAMSLNPEYLILSRYETELPKRRITVYFNDTAEVVRYIPFGKWKLFDCTEQFGVYKYYTLEDPTGILRSVSLTDYIPYIPKHLKKYIEYDSFKSYDLTTKNGSIKTQLTENEPVEIILEPNKSYLITVKSK